MSAALGSGIHVKGGGLVRKPAACAPSHQLNAVAALPRRVKVSRAFELNQRRMNPDNRFVYGTKLRSSAGSEMVRLWQIDGHGRSLKRLFVVKNAMSQVPEKSLGLYDPALDKDSCGVGFVAELSGESSRKTVMDAIKMLVRIRVSF